MNDTWVLSIGFFILCAAVLLATGLWGIADQLKRIADAFGKKDK
jgi:hypothetical protein